MEPEPKPQTDLPTDLYEGIILSLGSVGGLNRLLSSFARNRLRKYLDRIINRCFNGVPGVVNMKYRFRKLLYAIYIPDVSELFDFKVTWSVVYSYLFGSIYKVMKFKDTFEAVSDVLQKVMGYEQSITYHPMWVLYNPRLKNGNVLHENSFCVACKDDQLGYFSQLLFSTVQLFDAINYNDTLKKILDAMKQDRQNKNESSVNFYISYFKTFLDERDSIVRRSTENLQDPLLSYRVPFRMCELSLDTICPLLMRTYFYTKNLKTEPGVWNVNQSMIVDLNTNAINPGFLEVFNKINKFHKNMIETVIVPLMQQYEKHLFPTPAKKDTKYYTLERYDLMNVYSSSKILLAYYVLFCDGRLLNTIDTLGSNTYAWILESSVDPTKIICGFFNRGFFADAVKSYVRTELVDFVNIITTGDTINSLPNIYDIVPVEIFDTLESIPDELINEALDHATNEAFQSLPMSSKDSEIVKDDYSEDGFVYLSDDE